MSSRPPRSRVVSRSSAAAGVVEEAVPKVRAAAKAAAAAEEDNAAVPPVVALSQFAVGTALSTVSSALGLLVQVHQAQIQALRDLANVLDTAHQDLQQADTLQALWRVGLPGGRAASQLGGTLDSWRQIWRAQLLEARPNWAEQAPALQNPFTLVNTALQTSSRMLEGWVNTARKTTHAIVVMG